MGPPRIPGSPLSLPLLLLVVTREVSEVCCETAVTDPVFLPAGLELVDVPEYFRLQETGRYLHANTSLGARAETYLLSRQGSRTPVVRATYQPFSVLQEVPDDILTPGDSAAWSVRAVLIEGSVSPSDPYARVLFHLTGRDWLSEKPQLPCVIMQAFQQTRSVQRACRLQAPLGVCVVELEFPQRWFSASAAAAGHRLSEAPGGTAQQAELYFALSAAAGKKDECSREVRPGRQRRQGAEAAQGRLTRIATVEIKMAAVPRHQELQLDGDMMVRLPNRTLLPGEVFTATISVGKNFSADLVNVRVKFKKGLYVIFAHSAAPETWAVKLEKQKGSKPHTVLVTCRRMDGGASDWSAADFPEFLYLDFGVENGTGSVSTRRVSWQVEFPGPGASGEGEKVFWEVLVSERDLRAIVPLVKEEEILNTALLTGVPRKVPVKLVAVETGGFALDISEHVRCASSSVQVIQVTEACDFVYVAGKESRGALRIRVDFWYERLWTTLHFRVWVPLLPLRVEVSDTHLEQIRGWRAATRDRLSDLDQADEDGTVERKARECRAQYQRASVRFLAHFVAHPLDGGRHVTYLLGSDWLLDVSPLLREHARAKDPQIAVLEEGSVLIGREPGVTSVEVRSPVSHSVLGEQTVVVSEDKVSIAELRTQLVSGISLSLSSMAGYKGVIVATCRARRELQSYKQESILSIWFQFSDHTMAPIELYSWQNLKLTITSADHRMVSMNPNVDFTHPMILVSEGEGDGLLLQVALQAPELCQKGKHRGNLASGTSWVRVHVDSNEGRKKNKKIGLKFPTMSNLSLGDLDLKSESPFQKVEGAMLDEAPTLAAQSKIEVKKGRGIVPDSEAVPYPPVWKFDLGRSRDRFSSSESPHSGSMDNYDDDDDDADAIIKAPQPVTDLEIGMYVLLGVFSLAILIFLINCITFMLRYQRKKAPETDEAPTSQPHNWVWLGTDQQELSRQLDLRNQGQERRHPGDTKQGRVAGEHCDEGAPKAGEQGRALETVDEKQKDLHGTLVAECGVGVVGSSIGGTQVGSQDTQLGDPINMTNTFHPLQASMDVGLVNLSQGNLNSHFYSTLLRKELNKPMSDTLSQEWSSQGSNMLSRKELNMPVSGILSRKELNMPGSGTFPRKELNMPGSGTLSRKELNMPVSCTLSRKELTMPEPGTLPQEELHSQSSNNLTRQELNFPMSGALFPKELSSQDSITLSRKELNMPVPATLSRMEPGFPSSNTLSCKKQNVPASGILARKELISQGSRAMPPKKLGSQGSRRLFPELESQVPRRKRAEFVTFSPRISDGSLSAPVQSILVASEEDIRWVCEDMGLRDPEELQNYMERIRGSS